MKKRNPSPLWFLGSSLCLCLCLAVALTSCGSFQLPVSHSPLPPSPSHSKGTVLVHCFSDVRSVENEHHLGEVRNTSGLHCGPIVDSKNRPVAGILTDQFAEVLRAAGYQTIFSNTSFDYPDARNRANAVLQGEVRKCWLITNVGAVSDNAVQISILVQLRQPQTGELLYQKVFAREESYRASWTSALKKTMDAVLADALQNFSSAEFYQAAATGGSQTAAR